MKVKDQIKFMMRLESRFKLNWQKKKSKIFPKPKNSYNSYKAAEEKDVKKGLNIVVDCFLTSMREEIARLQREDHKDRQSTETKDEKR